MTEAGYGAGASQEAVVNAESREGELKSGDTSDKQQLGQSNPVKQELELCCLPRSLPLHPGESDDVRSRD